MSEFAMRLKLVVQTGTRQYTAVSRCNRIGISIEVYGLLSVLLQMPARSEHSPSRLPRCMTRNYSPRDATLQTVKPGPTKAYIISRC